VRRRGRTAALALVAGALLAAPAGAAPTARRLEPPRQGPLVASAFAPVRDVVVHTRAGAARAAALVAHSAATLFTTPSGVQLPVELSPSYVADRAAVQKFVDFLDSRLHGSELAKLTLVIATPQEVAQACSAQALACYSPAAQRMIVPGEQTPSGEAPLEFVITHEYGHHIAANRVNPPWPATTWGPKYWASEERICQGVLIDQPPRYYPGDETVHYLANPGENWAEAYALYHYRTASWMFDLTLKPDDNAFAAIQRDVATPWAAPVVVRERGAFRRASRATVQRFRVPLGLDGQLQLSLSGPLGSNFDLEVRAGGTLLGRTSARGSRDAAGGPLCREDSPITVRVLRRGGSGRYTLRISRPG